jgi:hypothetical protein
LALVFTALGKAMDGRGSSLFGVTRDAGCI